MTEFCRVKSPGKYIFFLTSTTDRVEKINKHMNSVNLLLIDITDTIMNRLQCSILPFRVLIHMFLFVGSNYSPAISKYCTRMYINNKKISDHVNKKLFVQVGLGNGIAVWKKIYLFAHSNIAAMSNVYGLNFGVLYYESTEASFMVWKLYLDVLCRVVFNVSYKHIYPLTVSGTESNCREFAVCTPKSCSDMKVNKMKVVFFGELVILRIVLAKISCLDVKVDFVNYIFNNYKKGTYCFNNYLGIEKYE